MSHVIQHLLRSRPFRAAAQRGGIAKGEDAHGGTGAAHPAARASALSVGPHRRHHALGLCSVSLDFEKGALDRHAEADHLARLFDDGKHLSRRRECEWCTRVCWAKKLILLTSASSRTEMVTSPEPPCINYKTRSDSGRLPFSFSTRGAYHYE